jgi:flagellar motor protein MotB
MKALGRILVISAIALAASGCQRPMFPGPTAQTAPAQWGTSGNLAPWFQRLPNGQVQYSNQQQGEQLAQLSQKLSEVNQQLARFDADNQGLHAQVAALQQKLDASQSFNLQLKQQLRDATAQMQQIQQAKSVAEQQLAALQNSAAGPPPTASRQNAAGWNPPSNPYQLAGSATLRANNSLLDKLAALQSQGINAWMDGDVIRVEFPSDTLFITGTYDVADTQKILLNNLASSIRQHFPQQFIGIEAHWDASQIQGAGNSLQQLTATQALAVFNHLAQAGLPASQMFTVGMAASRPRYANPSAQNRRVEIVIYPESFGGR